jgi:glycosyltransferase involved in cell wall biosynthesis
VSTAEELPFASVVVPTHNRAELLDEAVRSLCAQDYPADRYEVVVVDDGSTDRSPDVAAGWEGRFPHVRVLRRTHEGANAARNAGLAAARGDPICFVDDDQAMPPSWLRALVQGALRFPEAGCAGGPIMLRLEGRPPRSCGQEPLGEGELSLGSEYRFVEQVWGGNMALRRHAVDRIGAFREFRMLGGNEIEWQQRARAAGIPIVYVPGAYLYHRRTADELRLRRLVGRRFMRGWGQARNMAEAGRPYVPREEAQGVMVGLKHWATTGCSMGLLGAAQDGGRLLSIAARRWTSREAGTTRS